MATTGFTKNFVVKNGITTGNITLNASSGNITGTNLSVTGLSKLGNIGNVRITGGNSGQSIVTDGAGNLSFATATSNPAPMPTYVAVGDTLTILANYQGLFGYPITIDGTMTVDGVLVDVNDNGNGGGGGGTATALNATIANVIISGGTSGYYLQTDGAGALSWAAGGGGGSGSPGGVNTQVQFNDAGTFGGNSALTFNKTTGALVVTGNITGGNLVTGGIVSATGNITGSFILGNGSQLTGITATTATTAGTVTTAAQPNITSVGTLTSVSVTGNANIGNIIGNGQALTSITGANVTGYVPNATHANIADLANSATVANSVTLANVSGVGNIASINLDGNVANLLTGLGTFVAIPTVSANANYANFANIANIANSVAVANVSGIGNIATTNYNGNGSQVLAGNGAWVNSSGGGTSTAAAVGYSLIFGG